MNTVDEIKRISFSELKHWKECTYRHKLIYIDKLSPFKGNLYTAFGTSIHYVCEQIVPNHDLSEKAYQIFLDYFEKEIKQLQNDGVEIVPTLMEEMDLSKTNL